MENFNIWTFLPFYPHKYSICLQKHKHSLIFKNNYILLFEEWTYSGWCKNLGSNFGKCWNYGPPSSTQAQVHKLTHHWKCNQVKLMHPPMKLCNSSLFLAMSSFCPFRFTFLPLPISHKMWLMKPWNLLYLQLSQYYITFLVNIMPPTPSSSSWPAKLPKFLMRPPFYFHFSSLSFRSAQHNPF